MSQSLRPYLERVLRCGRDFAGLRAVPDRHGWRKCRRYRGKSNLSLRGERKPRFFLIRV